MKAWTTRFAAAFILALCLCGCDKNILRDSEQGKMYVSFRINGERYECAEKSIFTSSPMRIAFYDKNFLDFHVDAFSVKDNEKKACLRFTVSSDNPIKTGQRYYLQYHSGEEEDRVADPPVHFAEYNGLRSVEGWVKFREIDKKYPQKNGYGIVAGNFDFTCKDEDGNTFEIKHGSFDGII